MNWIADHYGSKSGMLKHFCFRAGWRFHPLAREAVDLQGINRLVFVCKGNICRSALAQAVADSLEFPACSFGFLTTPGKPADPGMSEASRTLGFDLSSHATTRISAYQPLPGDLMLFFEAEHLRHLGGSETLVSPKALLGMWVRPRRPYIHDPFGGSPHYYGVAAAVIREAVVNLVREIRSEDRE